MKRVLLTPLDWGLGHATRCIPVIRELQRQGCEVIIAGSGDSLELLRKEFPGFRFIDLPAYAPRYPVNGSMAVRMARQLPHFVQVISSEHRVVGNIVQTEKVDLIISDNRYGCWSERVPSVFITHQSNVLMPKRFGLIQGLVRYVSEHLINRFQTCWIPDFPLGDSLAGALISFGKIGVKSDVQYIGWLSRFEPGNGHPDMQFDVVAIFSGPEPQRTAFENVVVPQLKTSGLRFRVVRGLPSAGVASDDERVANFLTSSALQRCIESSVFVIARSGYSTVMDLQSLGKKAIFVPTPGQTEQEYLAARLMEKNIAFSVSQHDFDLETAMQASRNYSGFTPSGQNQLLREAVSKVLMYY